MARKITIKAFEAWIADEANVVDVLERLAEVHLHKVAVAVKQPYTCLYAYFDSTPELQARYEAACRARVSRRADEASDIADDCPPDRDHVAKAKLQIDVRHHHAKSYNPERWGDRLQIDKKISVDADPLLLGKAADLLNRLTARTEKVIEGGEVVGEVSPALPAARPPAE
jgi:hypothetical protein